MLLLTRRQQLRNTNKSVCVLNNRIRSTQKEGRIFIVFSTQSATWSLHGGKYKGEFFPLAKNLRIAQRFSMKTFAINENDRYYGSRGAILRFVRSEVSLRESSGFITSIYWFHYEFLEDRLEAIGCHSPSQWFFIFNITISPDVPWSPMCKGFDVGDISGDIGDVFCQFLTDFG